MNTHLRPSEAPERRLTCWSVSLAIWAVAAGLILFYSFYLNGWIHHTTVWFQANDAWGPVDAGRYVWNGALGFAYQGTISYALPLSFILSAPVSGLIDAHGLIEGAPYPVAHPSAWLLVAPYTLLYGLPLLVMVRRLAHDLGLRSRLWAVQVVCVPLMIIPCFYWGHFEDALALTFVVASLRRVLRADWVIAGILLSLAVASKQWALMLVPLVVAMAPRGTRVRCLAAATVLPATLTLFVLGADWADASRSLLSPVNLGANAPGHLSFYSSWLGSRTSQLSRALGTAVTLPMGVWLRRASGAPQLLGAMAAVLLVRPFAEAISYSYYWSPGLLLAGLTGVAATQRFRIRDWAGPVAAVAWANPRGNAATTGWWWAGELLLVALTVVQTAVNTGAIFRVVERWPDQVKKVIPEPIPEPMITARAVGDTSWNR